MEVVAGAEDPGADVVWPPAGLPKRFDDAEAEVFAVLPALLKRLPEDC